MGHWSWAPGLCPSREGAAGCHRQKDPCGGNRNCAPPELEVWQSAFKSKTWLALQDCTGRRDSLLSPSPSQPLPPVVPRPISLKAELQFREARPLAQGRAGEERIGPQSHALQPRGPLDADTSLPGLDPRRSDFKVPVIRTVSRAQKSP